MTRRSTPLLVAVLSAVVIMQGAVAVSFSAQDRAGILSHGPWPVAVIADPSNRLSGRTDAIELGRMLFAASELSGDANVSCATCHQPQRGFTDGDARSTAGRAPLDRNTLALWNLRLNRWFGWDGATDSLWGQSLRPLLSAAEMASSPAQIAQRLRTTASLRDAFQRVIGPAALSESDEAILVNVGKALAAYQETLTTPRTAFDAFRDALADGNEVAMQRYPKSAQRGLKIFLGEGRCGVCHSGPNFSNGEFQEAGIGYFRASGGVDSGRHGGIKKLKTDRFNLLGIYNDDASRRSATATRYVALRHRNFGEFRVPSLRNLVNTEPYMHAGSLPTLEAVVHHYSTLDPERVHAEGRRLLRPLGLHEGERRDLVAFLRSLSHQAGH